MASTGVSVAKRKPRVYGWGFGWKPPAFTTRVSDRIFIVFALQRWWSRVNVFANLLRRRVILRMRIYGWGFGWKPRPLRPGGKRSHLYSFCALARVVAGQDFGRESNPPDAAPAFRAKNPYTSPAAQALPAPEDALGCPWSSQNSRQRRPDRAQRPPPVRFCR